MTLRGRLTLMAAMIVGTVLTLAAVVCFEVMRSELRGQADDSLRTQASLVRRARDGHFRPRGRAPLPAPPSRAGGAAPFVQLLSPAGTVMDRLRTREGGLPVDARDRAVAEGSAGVQLRDRAVRGEHLRVITFPLPQGGALQLGRSLVSVDRALGLLRTVLIVLVLGGLALAVGLSRVFSRRVIAPIADLTAATRHIQATGDLSRRVSTRGPDEVGTLATRFNEMLERLSLAQGALEEAGAAQRQLIADASHELRTPVTSLRTNIEVLLADEAMDDATRRQLLSDVVEQTDELSAVVSDLIELARGDRPTEHEEDLDLGAIAREAVERAQRHAPHVSLRPEIEPWPSVGSPERLGRALNNVLDNAAKFSPPGGRIDVALRDGVFTVRDHGPGVDADDLPHLFDRFYRGRSAGPVHGSGLGLAIVRQVVEAHGGSVTAVTPPEGGLTVSLDFKGTSRQITGGRSGLALAATTAPNRPNRASSGRR